jgi:hypothetical protein
VHDVLWTRFNNRHVRRLTCLATSDVERTTMRGR